MASSNQLERIGSLVERLGPIDKKQRGMRIEAAEWNALIDVLRGILQVDRSQEESTQVALEQRFAAKSHEHLGEINLAWLDADLQARVGGQQGSVLTRTAFAEMEKKLQSAGGEIARLSALVEAQQKLIDRSTVDEVDRSKTLKQFETRFAGVENLRTLVTTVATDVNGIRGNVDALVELRKSLTDAQGNAIDVGKLKSDLAELGGLRENLKGVDGELLRLRDIEVKLKEVADATGVGAAGGLDRRLAELSGALEGRLNTRIDEHSNTLRATLEEQNSARETRLRTELNARVDARAQTLDETLGAKLAASENRTNAGIDVKLAQSAEAIRKDASDNAKALVESRLASVPDQVRATTAELITRLRTDLDNEIRAGVRTEIQSRFNALELQMTSRVTAIETKVNGFEARLPTLVAGHVDAARASLEATLEQRIAARTEAMRVALQETFTTQVKSSVAEAIGDLDGRVNTVVTSRLSGLDAAIARSVATATRNLPEQVGTEVRTQIAALDLSGQIKATTDSLTRQLRAEQAEALALQQAKISEALNNNVSLLRGEIGALRTDLTVTIDARVKQSNDALQARFSSDLRVLEGRLRPDVFRNVVIGPDRPIR